MHTTDWDRDLLREALHEIMERANLTQSAVGRLAGRDRTTANRWLKGTSQPNYEAAARFAAALTEEHPELSDMATRFMAAAGYSPSATPPPTATSPLESSGAKTFPTEDVLEELRKIARKEEKTIGDVLVERGLASAEELTLSEQKRGDRLVKDILESDLPEESKNVLLMDYVGTRRHHFREAGLIEGSEEK